MSNRRRLWAAGAVALVLLLASCGSSGASSPSSGSAPLHLNAAQRKLVAGARKEGGVLLFQEPFLGGQAQVEEWQKDFNRLYGLNITIQYSEGGNIPQNLAKLEAAFAGHQPSNSDIFVGSQTHIATLLQSGILSRLDSPADTDIKPAWVQGDGTAVPFYTRLPGIAYNTNQVSTSAVPKTYQGLLSLPSTVSITTTPYGSSFADLASPQVWGATRTIAFAKGFAPKVKGLTGCGSEQVVASGQFDLMAPDCAENSITQLKAKGAPVAYVIPKDAPEIAWFWGVVPKNAAHPDTAQLFLNYLLSPSAQAILYKYDYTDLNLIPGSHTAKEIKRYQAEGYHFFDADVNFAERTGAAQEAAVRQQVDAILAQAGR